MLLQLLYLIRSERQLVERLEFRWFVRLSIDERVFDGAGLFQESATGY
jgi:transposase